EWQYVLERASNKDVAPLERTMLAHARNALREGQCREAVLAAATAVEVLLMQKLLAEKAHEDAHRLEHYRKTLPLGQLIDNLKHLSLPAGLEQGLAHVRNNAMHRGTPVAANEAGEAIRLASEVVRQLSVLHHPN
ncbi:MAG: hypothetical protein ACK54F_00020, partial [Planctomycetia bacterium]